ncbi:MAG: carboxy terminal-processing peptidase [Candidatus Cyclobacteriaceae bacterium M2_1C_046]
MYNKIKKVTPAAIFFVLFFSLLSAGTGAIYQYNSFSDTTQLAPKPIYSEEARLVVRILSNFHYRSLEMNDSLSSVILDEYIKALDNNKSYFLASDIKEFEKYRNELDDHTKNGNLEPAYEIYSVFIDRFNERMEYVQNNLIHAEYDFTVEESYDTDRSDNPWLSSTEELNDLWRKVVKSQVLSLKLSDKEDDEIRELIEKRYERFRKSLSQNKSEDVFEVYMNTVASAYDPHTNYFSPQTSDQFKQNMSLSLEGIGARLQTDNDFTKVINVIPGGPADKSNKIQEGDRIIGVAQDKDGEMMDVIGWRIDDVVSQIKGPKGTTVRLEILPAETGVNGPSKVVTLVREKIKLEDQRAQKEIISIDKDGKKFRMGVIDIPTFYMDFEAYQAGEEDYTSTTRDVKRLINELQAENVDGLLIDLRNNGGGSLAEAIELTGLFIEKGPVVQVRNKSNQIQIESDEDPEKMYDGPLTVLINRFSASASEIFAGAIQDYGRGLVVGEQTFGKGTVQSMVDLGRYIPESEKESVGQLKLTLQKFYRITGSSTQHLGVTPDIELPSAFSADEFGESANASALAWDQIRAAPFNSSRKVTERLVTEINGNYKNRMHSDPHLMALVEETKAFKRNIEKDKISLNLEKRKAEIKEAEKAAKIIPDNTSMDLEDPSNEAKEIQDKLLKESLLILAEVVEADV